VGPERRYSSFTPSFIHTFNALLRCFLFRIIFIHSFIPDISIVPLQVHYY